MYGGFERTISTDFIVAVQQEGKLKDTFGQLQKLARGMYPKYGSQGFYGQSCELTIGEMYKDLKTIVTDCSFEWDNETPWEIKEGERAPMYCNVSLSFTVLDEKPDLNTKIYEVAG